jgi:hypothetical protein
MMQVDTKVEERLKSRPSRQKVPGFTSMNTQHELMTPATPSRFNRGTPRLLSEKRGRNSYQDQFGSGGYNWHVKRDPANLPHNRLPDIEPRVAIAHSMQHRWLNQRNHSASRQGTFLTQRSLKRKSNESRR